MNDRLGFGGGTRWADRLGTSALFAWWLLTLGGAVIIFAGILMHLDIYFRPTSLFNTIVMLVLLAGGIGLVARSLRAH